MKSIRTLIVSMLALALVFPSIVSPALAGSQPLRNLQAAKSGTTLPALSQPKQSEATFPIEIVSKRTASAKVFSQPDGTKQMQVYASPIHYPTQENNQTVWKDIDSNLKKSASGFENTTNSFSIQLPNDVSKESVILTLYFGRDSKYLSNCFSVICFDPGYLKNKS